MNKKVLKFSSSWCGPCKLLSPIFDEITEELKNMNIEFISVDVEEDEELTSKYSVRNIPTIVITDEDGNELDRCVGMKTKNDLINFITQ